MTVSKLKSGRWRSQVWHEGKWRSVPSILGGETSYKTKRAALAAKLAAQELLAAQPAKSLTVAEFRERWLSHPLFRRPKRSTMLHLEERTRGFADRFGDLPLTEVGDGVVAEWLADGHASTVPALRAMFSDAASAKAGRLVGRNPFAGLGLHKGTGNRHKQPPSEELAWELVRHARELTCSSFAAWLQVAAFTGMRPGELDALRWPAVDFERGRIMVVEQWNAKERAFTLPKNGRKREAILTQPAREALMPLARDREFCFKPPVRGEHFRPPGRSPYWKQAAAAAGWRGTLYLATRHFAGWYMTNVLDLPSEDVAFALGHEDGGELVRRVYGHRDRERALERVARAYDGAGNVTPLRVVRKDTA